MIRSALLLTFALLGLSMQPALGAEVQVSYKGVVTQANGPQASSFLPGQEINIRYVVEATTVDSNANASVGVYFNGLRRLDVSIVGSGVSVTTGHGTIQTFNDIGSDQVFIYSSAASGSIGGLPVTFAEVDFVDYEADSEGRAGMLASDAIPTKHLITNDNTVTFGTSAGYTSIRFLAEPAAACSSEGFTGIKQTLCKQICEVPQASTRLSALIKAYVAAYREEPPCVR